jgi:thiamine biosynthesis protein ThiS
VSIKVTVNGRPREAPAGTTVARLLEELEVGSTRVAVEHNRRVLKRGEFSEIRLEDGDTLEIVHFVGGG